MLALPTENRNRRGSSPPEETTNSPTPQGCPPQPPGPPCGLEKGQIGTRRQFSIVLISLFIEGQGTALARTRSDTAPRAAAPPEARAEGRAEASLRSCRRKRPAAPQNGGAYSSLSGTAALPALASSPFAIARPGEPVCTCGNRQVQSFQGSNRSSLKCS